MFLRRGTLHTGWLFAALFVTDHPAKGAALIGLLLIQSLSLTLSFTGTPIGTLQYSQQSFPLVATLS